MTEDEKEELVYRLWEEFATSIKCALDDDRMSVFCAGARSAIYELTVSRSCSPIATSREDRIHDDTVRICQKNA